MEAPAYGYNPGDSASIVNKQASSFYNSTECLCFADDSCKDPTVTISNVGWLPLTPLPIKVGGDGLTYAADSVDPASPWFESMVFPENPSGKIKTPQIPDPNRRVCVSFFFPKTHYLSIETNGVLVFSFAITGRCLPLAHVFWYARLQDSDRRATRLQFLVLFYY